MRVLATRPARSVKRRRVFGLCDLPHGTVGAFEDFLRIPPAPWARSSLKLALLALKVPVGVAESRSRFCRSDSDIVSVLLEVSLHLLQLLRYLGELLPALENSCSVSCVPAAQRALPSGSAPG